MASPSHQVDGAARKTSQSHSVCDLLKPPATAVPYPSAPVSGLAWKPKGLFFRQAFRSSAMRVLAMPLIPAKPQAVSTDLLEAYQKEERVKFSPFSCDQMWFSSNAPSLDERLLF